MGPTEALSPPKPLLPRKIRSKPLPRAYPARTRAMAMGSPICSERTSTAFCTPRARAFCSTARALSLPTETAVTSASRDSFRRRASSRAYSS